MPSLQGWEWLILILVVLLLFGAKKLPETARGLGRSLRIFKAETKSMREDDEQPAPPVQPPVQQLPPAQPYQPPVQAPPVQQPYTPGPVGPPAPPQHDPAPYDR